MPPSTASNLTVLLCGAGPGLYLDFATLSFHVPASASAAAAVRAKTTSATTSPKQTDTILVLVILNLPVVGCWIDCCRDDMRAKARNQLFAPGRSVTGRSRSASAAYRG